MARPDDDGRGRQPRSQESGPPMMIRRAREGRARSADQQLNGRDRRERRMIIGPLRVRRRRRVEKHLLSGDRANEQLQDMVHHHWVVYLPAWAEMVGAALIFGFLLFQSPTSAGVLMLVVIGLLGHAVWQFVVHFWDVFVVTDLRVLRVNGLLSDDAASTPLTRILDITVSRPLAGRVLGFGHFTFESAAQEQGLRDIRFVDRPQERDQMIQGLQLRLLSAKKDQTPRSSNS